MSKFDTCFRFVKEAEGGFTVDNGGPTMHGVTQSTYDRFRKLIGKPVRSVKEMTAAEESALYRRLYYNEAHCAVMALPLAVAHFDWSVNHGVAGAIQMLQRVAGVAADGVFGPVTTRAITEADLAHLLPAYIEARRTWYETEYRRNPARPIDGWRNRIINLWAYLWRLNH